MTAYLKPAVRSAWGETDPLGGPDLVDPGNTFVQSGWQIGIKPVRQFDNWAKNFVFNAVRYFCQVGVVDYDAAETYGVGAWARGPDGLVYRSLVAGNIGHTPATSPTQWGPPTVPTPVATDNSNAIASTAFVTSNFLKVGSPFSVLSGSIANGQVPVSAVTQWQGSLAISFSQMVGSIANGQVPVGAVTQWQAALAIAWGQITGTKNADQLLGAIPGPAGAFSGSSLARYDGGGNLYAEYLNQASPQNENPTISQIAVNNGTDNFWRKASLQALKNAIAGTQSLNTTGFARLPGGLLLQWGSISTSTTPPNPIDITVGFATPFNIQVFFAACSTRRNVSTTGQAAFGSNFVSNVALNSMTITIDNENASPPYFGYWFAIGV